MHIEVKSKRTFYIIAMTLILFGLLSLISSNLSFFLGHPNRLPKTQDLTSVLATKQILARQKNSLIYSYMNSDISEGADVFFFDEDTVLKSKQGALELHVEKSSLIPMNEPLRTQQFEEKDATYFIKPLSKLFPETKSSAVNNSEQKDISQHSAASLPAASVPPGSPKALIQTRSILFLYQKASSFFLGEFGVCDLDSCKVTIVCDAPFANSTLQFLNGQNISVHFKSPDQKSQACILLVQTRHHSYERRFRTASLNDELSKKFIDKSWDIQITE